MIKISDVNAAMEKVCSINAKIKDMNKEKKPAMELIRKYLDHKQIDDYAGTEHKAKYNYFDSVSTKLVKEQYPDVADVCTVKSSRLTVN